MYENNKFSSPWVRIKNLGPLFWGILLVLGAALLALIPLTFFRTIAILPLGVGALMLYQAIYRNKY